MEPPLEKIWQCMNQKCGAVLREAEVKFLKAGRDAFAICSRCGGRLVDASKPAEPVVKDVEEVFEFSALLPKTFLYPFFGNGIFTLVAGGLVLSAAQLISFSPLSFVTLGLHGYLAAFFFDIVLTTANGSENLPEWPDFSDLFEDVLRPFAKFSWAMLCGFLPLALFLCLGWQDWGITANVWRPWTVVGVLLLAPIGVFYFPMALLAVAMFDSFSAVHPLRVFPSIFRVLLPYLVVGVLFGFVLGVKFLFPVILSFLVPAWIAFCLAQFLSLYLSMVNMRMLGILYRAHQKKLGWF